MVYIPNGDITQATNYSKQNSIAVIDINIGHKTPPEEAIPIIEQVMQTLEKEQENIVGNASVVGVQALNDSSYTLRATAECNPCTHWGIVRLAQQQIRAEFMKHGVDLPIQKIVYTHDTMTDNQES
jgi:small conductance mechanosensitive channel